MGTTDARVRRALLLALVVCTLGLHSVGVPAPISGPLTAVSALLLAGMLCFAARVSWLPRAALAACATMVLVAGADLALRRALADTLWFRHHDRFIRRWPIDRELSRYDANVAFEGEEFGDLAAMSGRPELRIVRRNRFETDDRGFRNSPGAGGGPLDVIVLGDSFAVGVGTTQEAILARQLETRFGLATRSLAVPGSPWLELLDLKAELPSLPVRPGTTVLWMLFSGNDLDESYEERLEVEPAGTVSQWWTAFRSWRKRSPLRLLLREAPDVAPTIERALPDGKPVLFYAPYVARAARGVAELRAHPNLPALRRVLEEMARLASDHGFRVVAAVIPTKGEVYPWLLDGGEPWAAPAGPSPWAEVVAELCAPFGIDCLDMKADLVEAARAEWNDGGELLWWRDDTHWNERGHAAAAEIVQRRLLAPAARGGS